MAAPRTALLSTHFICLISTPFWNDPHFFDSGIAEVLNSAKAARIPRHLTGLPCERFVPTVGTSHVHLHIGDRNHYRRLAFSRRGSLVGRAADAPDGHEFVSKVLPSGFVVWGPWDNPYL